MERGKKTTKTGSLSRLKRGQEARRRELMLLISPKVLEYREILQAVCSMNWPQRERSGRKDEAGVVLL